MAKSSTKAVEGEVVKMGRPTKLTPTLKATAHAWLLEQSKHEKALPTVEGLALQLNISRETLYAWEKENQDFSDILENLRQVQANKLIQKGLNNEYNATIAKMILSGKHGYVEKTEVDNTHKGEVTFTNEVPRPKLNENNPRT